MSSIQVKCARCGGINELNRVFCLKCGEKLDLAKAIAIRERGQARSFLSRIVRIVVILLILAIVGIIFWPVEPRGVPGSAAHARAMTETFRLCYQANQNRAVMSWVVTEAEVNGYLAEVMKQNKNTLRSDIFRLGIREINVAFTRENLIVLVLANWGPLPLSYEIKMTPSVQSGRFEAMVQEARWGHMPLPGPLAAWMSRRVAGLFLRMEKELAVLNSLGRFDLRNGCAYIETRGA